MYAETPNKEEVDWVEDRVRELYRYERLKDCDIDFLHNLEFAVEHRMLLFESAFPPEESSIQGPTRAYVFDDENADKVALTEDEKIRMSLLKAEAQIEIHRAKGHRLELRREQRNKFANSIADAVGSVADAIASLFGR
ncbi:hypothetical protein [Halorarius litoreus]|uniref:hypothetical protein n=1 Tax=Halorarius litoreus TaxID=2962676 RepID=UPI0020CC6A96|nr:hypothetical protein [Halorarius litoreus]